MICYKVLRLIEIPLGNDEAKTYYKDAPEEHNIVYTNYHDAERRANELSERGTDDFVVYEYEEE